MYFKINKYKNADKSLGKKINQLLSIHMRLKNKHIFDYIIRCRDTAFVKVKNSDSYKRMTVTSINTNSLRQRKGTKQNTG